MTKIREICDTAYDAVCEFAGSDPLFEKRSYEIADFLERLIKDNPHRVGGDGIIAILSAVYAAENNIGKDEISPSSKGGQMLYGVFLAGLRHGMEKAANVIPNVIPAKEKAGQD